MVEMKDESWLCNLAFLVDITTCMNKLNTRLQQKAQCASEMYGHIKGFMNKLRLWHAHTQNANLSHILTLKEMGMRPEKKNEFADELEKFFNEFSARFKDFKSHEHLFEIFSTPFHIDIDKAPTDIQMELIDLQKRTDLKAKYVEINLDRRRCHCLKGIHSRSDTNKTGAEGLSFYYPRLLYCLNQMLAVVLLSQHRVSSSKTVRPRAPCGARCIGHAVSTWSAVCSEAPHSQFDVGARPHLCMDE